MSSSKPEPPKTATSRGSNSPSPAKAGASDRLAAALRDNLKRRKSQARARREPGPGRDEG
jgi:hypothetical protein